MAQTFVSIIGSGNLAWHLAPALDNAGFVIKEIYSRNPRHAELLTERLYQAEVKASLDFSTSNSKVFILAVSDDAIGPIAQEIVLPNDALLVHTSGSQSIDELQYAAAQHLGVLYPLQTFSKNKKIDFKSLPIFLQTNTQQAETILFKLAQSLSNQVTKITSQERKALHVAAVFASNFTNHMLAISQGILQQNSIDFAFLKPLIEETVHKSLALGPSQSQTGPASRGDLETLDKHMEFLREDAAVAEIYRVVSQHILDRHQG
jgi:predicted short-subunit dehydrogenase-like oxidoreductase (DUF2520 family)